MVIRGVLDTDYPMLVVACADRPQHYFVCDGNHRLAALHLLQDARKDWERSTFFLLDPQPQPVPVFAYSAKVWPGTFSTEIGFTPDDKSPQHTWELLRLSMAGKNATSLVSLLP